PGRRRALCGRPGAREDLRAMPRRRRRLADGAMAEPRGPARLVHRSGAAPVQDGRAHRRDHGRPRGTAQRQGHRGARGVFRVPAVALHAGSLTQRLKSFGVELPLEREAALGAFLELLERWNRVYNLTAVRDPDEIVARHFVESLALRPLLRGERIADVGTGAGFPGMPLAIAAPERSFTLIDSRAKRIRFLRHVVAELGLRNVELVQGRAEHLRPERPFAT